MSVAEGGRACGHWPSFIDLNVALVGAGCCLVPGALPDHICNEIAETCQQMRLFILYILMQCPLIKTDSVAILGVCEWKPTMQYRRLSFSCSNTKGVVDSLLDDVLQNLEKESDAEGRKARRLQDTWLLYAVL